MSPFPVTIAMSPAILQDPTHKDSLPLIKPTILKITNTKKKCNIMTSLR